MQLAHHLAAMQNLLRNRGIADTEYAAPMRTRQGATVKRPPRTTLGFVATDLCDGDTTSPSPLADSCADADTAHKMRHGCDLRDFPVRPSNLYKTRRLRPDQTETHATNAFAFVKPGKDGRPHSFP